MVPHILGKAEKLLDRQQDFSATNRNSFLEFHHIHQYFENDRFLDSWTVEQKASYLHIVKTAVLAKRMYVFLTFKLCTASTITQLSYY